MAARAEGRQNVATAVNTVSTCSLDDYLVLPDDSCDGRIRAAREILGEQCVVLGHHYQRDEVIQFSDYQGDSWRLSELASQATGQYIVFCGVHFMAESADILARPDYQGDSWRLSELASQATGQYIVFRDSN